MDDIFFNQWRMSASSITLPNIYSSWYVWLIIHYCISYNLQIDWPQRHTVTLLENRYTIKRLITLLWIYTLLGVLQPKEPWYLIILIHFSVDIDQYFNHLEYNILDDVLLTDSNVFQIEYTRANRDHTLTWIPNLSCKIKRNSRSSQSVLISLSAVLTLDVFVQ